MYVVLALVMGVGIGFYNVIKCGLSLVFILKKD